MNYYLSGVSASIQALIGFPKKKRSFQRTLNAFISKKMNSNFANASKNFITCIWAMMVMMPVEHWVTKKIWIARNLTPPISKTNNAFCLFLSILTIVFLLSHIFFSFLERKTLKSNLRRHLSNCSIKPSAQHILVENITKRMACNEPLKKAGFLKFSSFVLFNLGGTAGYFFAENLIVSLNIMNRNDVIVAILFGILSILLSATGKFLKLKYEKVYERKIKLFQERSENADLVEEICRIMNVEEEGNANKSHITAEFIRNAHKLMQININLQSRNITSPNASKEKNDKPIPKNENQETSAILL